MLVFKSNPADSNRKIIVDGRHPVFAGTQYQDDSEDRFSITCIPVSATERAEIRLANTMTVNGSEMFNSNGHMKAVFMKMVRDWRGISFGNGDVECNEQNKLAIFDSVYDFASKIIGAVLSEMESVEVRKAEETKN